MMLAELPLRILPAQVITARRPQRMLERMWVVNRAGGWTIVVTGFFEPLFYLLSIRIGFGSLIGDVEYVCEARRTARAIERRATGPR